MELTSDLMMDAFIASLRRFHSRRGKSSLIRSDNGRKFVGASHEIAELMDFLKTQKTQSVISEFSDQYGRTLMKILTGPWNPNPVTLTRKFGIIHPYRPFCCVQSIECRFSPECAPHFGGLWEAAVKVMKKYLRYVITNTKLTFGEFSTLLAQIESCLNCRPLVQRWWSCSTYSKSLSHWKTYGSITWPCIFLSKGFSPEAQPGITSSILATMVS